MRRITISFSDRDLDRLKTLERRYRRKDRFHHDRVTSGDVVRIALRDAIALEETQQTQATATG